MALLNGLLPGKFRIRLLFCASLIIYGLNGPEGFAVLLISVALTYFSGRLLDRRKSKLLLTLTILCDLLLLFYYKYFGFFTESLCRLLSFFGIPLQLETGSGSMPVGLSFFIFQTIAYVIDVYRGKTEAEKNIVLYTTFISFFPHITSGPIARANALLPQLREMRRITYKDVQEGVFSLLWGLFLKLVIANRIALYVDTVYADYKNYCGWFTIIAILLYSLQIYADFYGYSMLALGTAKLFGIDLAENFHAPYLSSGVSEFWRNWHISLTTWFRDYLYFPLGGSRKGEVRKYVNKMIVFLVSGLWHGASFGFIIWGGLNGLFQIMEELPDRFRKGQKERSGFTQSFIRFLKGLVSYLAVSIAWVFFRANGAREALSVIRSAFYLNNFSIFQSGEVFSCGVDLPNAIVLLFSLGLLLTADISLKKGIRIREQVCRWNGVLRVLFVSLSVLVILLFGIYGPAFNAANFIYYRF